MKHETAIQAASTPAIFKLLPEDRSFRRMADLHELIARRAFKLFAERGFCNGPELEDWLRAEPQLLKSIPLEVSETQDALTIKASLPGYGAKDVEIHVEPKRLFITGPRQKRSEEKEGKAFYSEQVSNRLFRSIELPAEIDPEKVRATLGNGELRIDLPKVGGRAEGCRRSESCCMTQLSRRR
jgi:HSP20 family protein